MTHDYAAALNELYLSDIGEWAKDHLVTITHALTMLQKHADAIAKLEQGGVVVPAEPSEKMVEAGTMEYWRLMRGPDSHDMAAAYKAMIAVAQEK